LKAVEGKLLAALGTDADIIVINFIFSTTVHIYLVQAYKRHGSQKCTQGGPPISEG
jgi:hypothetical protein